MDSQSIRIPASFPDPGSVAGRRVVITGASRGLGRLLVEAFAGRGAQVLAVARTHDDLDRHRAEGDGHVEICAADVASVDGNEAAVASAQQAFGGIDVWIANAGVSPVVADIADMELAQWREIMSVNLDGLFLSCRAAARVVDDGGRIIVTGSVLGERPRRGLGAYSASKAAALGLVKTLALELAGRGVTANVVAPGWFTSPLAMGWQRDPVLAEAIMQHTALARWGSSEDLPGAFLFLASRASDFITGTVVNVDGGYLCI